VLQVTGYDDSCTYYITGLHTIGVFGQHTFVIDAASGSAD